MKIKELIVVEGKTDLIFLKSFLEADIVITNGSEISQKTLDFIKEANKKQGVIILTDPDYPGLRIRNIISEYIGDCFLFFYISMFAITNIFANYISYS